jgi:replication-associated recombination protein RarA
MPTLFHKDTKNLIDALKSSATQAILITGGSGSGTLEAAKIIAGTSLIDTILPTDIKGTPDSEKGSVRIVQIRAMSERVQTISKSIETIIIDNADTMGAPAQNAFLKLLEEPRPNLRFILTAHNPVNLLPTILSRVQRVTIRPLSLEQSEQLITDLGIHDARKIQQMLFLAQGLPAELSRLAQDADYFQQQLVFAGDARIFLQGTIAEKTVVANRYHASRPNALLFLAVTQRILSHSLYTKPSRDIIASLSRYAQAHEAIAAGGNIKLHLLACVV